MKKKMLSLFAGLAFMAASCTLVTNEPINVEDVDTAEAGVSKSVLNYNWNKIEFNSRHYLDVACGDDGYGFAFNGMSWQLAENRSRMVDYRNMFGYFPFSFQDNLYNMDSLDYSAEGGLWIVDKNGNLYDGTAAMEAHHTGLSLESRFIVRDARDVGCGPNGAVFCISKDGRRIYRKNSNSSSFSLWYTIPEAYGKAHRIDVAVSATGSAVAWYVTEGGSIYEVKTSRRGPYSYPRSNGVLAYDIGIEARPTNDPAIYVSRTGSGSTSSNLYKWDKGSSTWTLVANSPNVRRLTVDAAGNPICITSDKSLKKADINEAVVYVDTDFKGRKSVALPVGNYNLTDLEALGIPNDSISSIILVDRGRSKVEFFEHHNFSGRSFYVRSSLAPSHINIENLQTLEDEIDNGVNFNDNISSMRITLY